MSVELYNRLSELQDKELVDGLKRFPDDYTKEALAMMQQILDERGVSEADIERITGEPKEHTQAHKSNKAIKKLSTLVRWLTEAYQSDKPKKELKGLGGWLAVVGCVMAIRLFEILGNVYATIKQGDVLTLVFGVPIGFYEGDIWTLVFGVPLGIYSVVLLRMYANKSPRFPTHFIVVTSILWLLSFVASLAVGDTRGAVGYSVAAVVQIAYISTSRRVKATFARKQADTPEK